MDKYLAEIINQLIEKAVELKRSSKNEFEKELLFRYYEIISKLLNQAEAFGISDEIALKWQNFNPKDLLNEIN